MPGVAQHRAFSQGHSCTLGWPTRQHSRHHNGLDAWLAAITALADGRIVEDDPIMTPDLMQEIASRMPAPVSGQM
jgi:hypothetical protein